MENLAPGFRFYPTEEELILFYLHSKLHANRQDLDSVIPVLCIYDFNPSDLPQLAGERCRGDPEQWFFFIPRQERELRGGRPNRLTTSGYWKAAGSPSYVYASDNRAIGVKRSMVFYLGRFPTGRKTEWKMNEYQAIDGDAPSSKGTVPKLRKEFSLCRVYKNSNKWARAFDRRPSTPMSGKANVQQAHIVDEPTTSHHPNDLPTMERNCTPADRQAEAFKNWDISIEDEPIWDWDELGWL
ncbi:unnamed protein product [Thlaspi arvense]|uniref:NAC domain-containing protein n=1 Tax=Thlaspi arvense TaxID=13288 RepID=A0AAU9T1T4_THLAR|nr:unnamed protein product [Thlaspi arvense]